MEKKSTYGLRPAQLARLLDVSARAAESADLTSDDQIRSALLREAIRAVEVLNDQFFMGRKLIVSGAKSKGQDEREDMEGRTDPEPRKVVVASIPQAVAVAETAVEAPAAADEVAAVAEESEPVIQTIVENVTEAAVEESPAVAEVADDLVHAEPEPVEEHPPRQDEARAHQHALQRQPPRLPRAGPQREDAEQPDEDEKLPWQYQPYRQLRHLIFHYTSQ